MGYNEEQDAGVLPLHQYGMAWCEPVEDQIRPNDCLLRTYIYDVYSRDYSQVWQVPAPAEQITLAYSAFGIVNATDVMDVGGAHLGLRTSFSISSPFGSNGGIMHFEVAASQRAEVVLFDVVGRRVWRVEIGVLGPGRHTIPFDAIDDRGMKLASGIYIASVRLNGHSYTQKIAIVQ